MCLGIPGEVTEIAERDGLRFGRVRFGGVYREVCLEYQPDAAVGDFVLVHVGFAISTIDRDEAERTWALLLELGEAEELGPPEGFEDDGPPVQPTSPASPSPVPNPPEEPS